MKDVDLTLVELAASQHQVFSRAQARTAGLSASALSRRIASGQLVGRGTSSLHLAGVTLSYRGRLMAGLIDLGPGALVSGRAAGHLHGFDGFEEGPPEFLVPRRQRDRTTEGLVHSTSSMQALDRSVIDGLPCTSATRTVVELLGGASEREAGNALDSATRMRLTAPAVVRRRLDQLGRQGRAGVRVFERLALAGCVESALERRFVAVVRSSGLPLPLLQQRFHLPGVGIARVDFEFANYPVVVEVGGRRGYLSSSERQHQEHRRNALQVAGKTIYFFTREDVELRPEYVISTLFEALKGERVGPDCGNRNPARLVRDPAA